MQHTFYDPKRNSFAWLRLVLAAGVIFSHAFDLTGAISPLSAWTGGRLTEGHAAVDAFLVISGFLIAQSAERRGFGGFLKARALRIFPGMAVAVLITVFLLGGLGYAGTYAAYLRQGDTWTYLRHTLTLNIQAEPLSIAGVFLGNPVAGLNISLWTVKFEVAFYLLMAALLLLRLNRRTVYMALAAAFGLLYGLHALWGVQLWRFSGGWVMSAANYGRLVRLGWFFFAGASLYTLRDALPKTWWFTLLAIGLLIGSGFLGLLPWAHALMGPWLILRIGALRIFSHKEGRIDLSYGLYLYAYPIQQQLVQLFPAWPAWGNFLLGLTVAGAFALWSWFRVERPALCKL